jgi:galacturonokinase
LGNYPRGAVAALEKSGHVLKSGLFGITLGGLEEGGLSSSAAAGVAYLLALEATNELDFSPWENIELDRLIENEYLGLRNGIMDQSAILLSRKDSLTVIDCKTHTHALVPRAATMPPFSILLASSGVRQSLVSTGYNLRVAECAEAAHKLLNAAGRSCEQPLLGHVTREEYLRHHHELSDEPVRRAQHFFSEMERVEQGIEAWRVGDLVRFASSSPIPGAPPSKTTNAAASP